MDAQHNHLQHQRIERLGICASCGTLHFYVDTFQRSLKTCEHCTRARRAGPPDKPNDPLEELLNHLERMRDR